MIEHLFTDREQLYQKTTQHCLRLLQAGLEKTGKASFIVPGGTTPAPIFQQLSQQVMDWKNISIALSDERWLEPSHPQSNQKLIEETLLINHAANANFMGMKNSHETAASGEVECHQNYRTIPSPFDVVMLGMGPDGHFASLFPGTDQISEALNLTNQKYCMAIDAKGCPVAGEYSQRISMTLAALLNSKSIILLFTGEEKLEVLRKAMVNEITENLPVSALIHQTKVPVELFWAR